MAQFISILTENLELFCSVVLSVVSLISLIVATFRKKKFFRLEDFILYLSTCCSIVEHTVVAPKSGSDKLQIVLSSARDYVSKYHLGLSDDDIIKLIEGILSSPTKKDNN